MADLRSRPLEGYVEYPPEEMERRAADFLDAMRRRRTVRHFSDRPVPRRVIEDCVAAAATAPSGANMQPWRFVVISDAAIKARIRAAAEREEREFYSSRAPEGWLKALAPLGTDADKPFLETAPWLIAVFAERFGHDATGRKVQHYYVTESVGIATGVLITALHHAGLVCLTHTPSPMRFLNDILQRPSNERPFLLMVTGHPAAGVEVPDLTRKPLAEVATFLTGAPDTDRPPDDAD
jgi:iodotyrosine deiodinase